MKDIVFIEPIAQQRIWGGTGLAERFRVPFCCPSPGEIIAAAGFPGHDTALRGKNRCLSQFYAAHRDYFGLSLPQFPLAVNLLDAREKLSVQTHPTEEYAREHEACCGLPEAWVILDAAKGAELVAGHRARTRAEFAQLASEGNWERLLTTYPVERGDCFVIPPGTVHSVGAGIQIYEVTHAADVVYRLYDYGRLDASSGVPRALQLEKALDVVYAPQVVRKSKGADLQRTPELSVKELVDLPGVYTIRKITTMGSGAYSQEEFGIYTVIDGEGTVNGQPIRQGDTFIAPCGNFKLDFYGMTTCCMATYRQTAT